MQTGVLKYVKGDLFSEENKCKYIVHQVNCQGVMGSGIALEIKNRYPLAFKSYKDYCSMFDNTKNMLGKVDLSESNGKIIANLFAQDHYLPRGICHTDYNALEQGFNFLKDITKEDISMPKIGCGLGGGDWNKVEELIKKVFDDRTVFVYIKE